ncbi:MAG: TlpA disulfide reductase family protein [Pseudomonadota bacterium]
MSRAFRSVVFSGMLVLFSTVALAVSPTIIKDPINFSDYKGKWLVISYWATWCNYCMEEIPELNAFYRAHRNEVVMFGVNYEDGPVNELPERIQESAVAFPTFSYDPKPYFHFRIGRISGLPTTLLIGPDGNLKRVLEGPQTKRSLENALGLL